MNTDTGELISAEKFARLAEEEKKKFTPVPERLSRAARRKLAGKDQAMASLTSGGKLSRWAAKKRKAKRRATKLARRLNRK